MSLSRAELLNEFRPKTEIVTLADGGQVMVSELGAADYINLWAKHTNATDGSVDMATFIPALVAFCCVDDQGTRLFSDEDIPLLARAASSPFMQLATVVKQLNGLGGEPDEAKNSVASPADSSSGSPSN